MGQQLFELSGESDHLHLLLALPANHEISRFVNNLKTTSSRLLRREFATMVVRFSRKPSFLEPFILGYQVRESPINRTQRGYRIARGRGIGWPSPPVKPRALASALSDGGDKTEGSGGGKIVNTGMLTMERKKSS
ncbi:hypothetical protein MFUM_760007 [Methylacidiphilum fumariolicum SolV]|uniref:Transposase IS200-like domain-containing protein n=1 Tax=Methylacidiphilum fumariolicum (strain SolV) TaxID=1156937 RepID=I0JZS2_METFB|nr:transposase [Candidatus Methylacidiphilum fumarolicum]CCG92741.1 hypothetical protein MFUM_760007 [Methylacidiphilum fumariolicum SolV]